MKTFRLCGMLLMAVLMAFSFSACGDDDDDEDQPASIVGTQWYSANDVNGQILSYTIFSFRQGGMLDAEHLIIENGKWYKGLSHRYPYSINGNKISITFNEGYPAENAIWDGHNSPLPGFKRLKGEVLELYKNARPDSELINN